MLAVITMIGDNTGSLIRMVNHNLEYEIYHQIHTYTAAIINTVILIVVLIFYYIINKNKKKKLNT